MHQLLRSLAQSLFPATCLGLGLASCASSPMASAPAIPLPMVSLTSPSVAAPAPSAPAPSAARPAQTGDLYGPAPGESELTFGGSFGHVSTEIGGGGSLDVRTLDGQVGYGRYVTEHHEYGGQLIFNISQPDQGDDTGNLGILPYYRYNFRPSERTWYYAGVHAGLIRFEAGGESDMGFSCGIHGGMKSWLTPQISFFVEPRLTFSEVSLGSVDVEVDEFRTLLGFTYSL